MNSTCCKAAHIITTVLSGLLLGSPALAQQNTEAAASSNSGELQEIVVTARKRQESILQVPVIEVAIPQAELQNLQAVEITDLPNIVPGLQFGRGLLAIGQQVSMRGVGSTSLDPGVDPSVALNVDGLSPGGALAFDSGMFDVAQVEVLKGPQALFFGKSTDAGVISLRTADPTDQFEVIARTSYEFVAETPREEAIISGPVTDTLKARLAAFYQTSEGYFKNTGVADTSTGAVTPTDPRSPRSFDYVVRGTVLWNPTDQVDARLKLNLVRDHIVDQEIEELSDCPQGPNFAPFGIPFIGNDPCKINRDNRAVWMNPADYPGIINNGVPFTDIQQEFAILELNYRPVQDLTVTSVTANYLLKSDSLVNAATTVDAGTPDAAQNLFHRRELTEEMRVNSEFKSPFNFSAGAFYEDGKITQVVAIPGDTALPLSIAAPLGARLPPLVAADADPVDIRTFSIFGQVRWDIVSKLELAVGSRWSDETRTEAPINGCSPTVSIFCPQLADGAPIPVLQNRVHANNNSPEFTLTYKPTDDLTAFGSWKQGFKSGSFVLATPPTPNSNNAFNEETVRGAETGIKSRWLDRHLTANIAAYLYNYSGLQVGAIAPTPQGIPHILTENAGAARTYGVDFDTEYRPRQIEGLMVNASVGWNHARYVNLVNVPCWGGQTIAEGCNEFLNKTTGFYTGQNLSGTPMIRAPAWQVQFGPSYEFPLPRGYTMLLGSNNNFQTRYVTFLAINRPNQDQYQGSFIKSDLSLSLKAPDDSWEIALIGKDIGDKITAGSCAASDYGAGVLYQGVTTGGTNSGKAGPDQVGCFVDPGREVWLRLTVRPFAARP